MSRSVFRVLPLAPGTVSSRSSSVRPGFHTNEKMVANALRKRGVAALAGTVRLGQLDGRGDRLHHEEQLRRAPGGCRCCASRSSRPWAKASPRLGQSASHASIWSMIALSRMAMLATASASAWASVSTWSRYCRTAVERRLGEVEQGGRTRVAAEIGKDCLSDVLVHEEVGDVVGDVGGPAGQPLEDRLLAHDRLRRDRDPLDRGDRASAPAAVRRPVRAVPSGRGSDRGRGVASRGPGADVYNSCTAVIASPSVVNRHTPKLDRNIIWRALRIRSSADWCRAAIVCSAENTWSGSASWASTPRRRSGGRRIGVGRSASGRSSSSGFDAPAPVGRLGRVEPGGQLGSDRLAGFVVVQPAVRRQQHRAAQQLGPGRGDEVVLGAALGQQHEVVGGPVPAEALDADAGPEQLLQEHRAAVERPQVHGHHVLEPARRELGDPGGTGRCRPASSSSRCPSSCARRRTAGPPAGTRRAARAGARTPSARAPTSRGRRGSCRASGASR